MTPPKAQIPVYLDYELIVWYEEEAKRRDLSRNALITEAMIAYRREVEAGRGKTDV